MRNERDPRATLTSVAPGAGASDWLRRFGALTSEREREQPGDHLLNGSRAAARCVDLARKLLSRPCPRHHEPGGRGACMLGVGPSVGRACLLALDLAAGSSRLPEAEHNDIAWEYMNALVEAADAVYFCRRSAHAGGHCWFSEGGPDDDLCGRVLTVAHGLRLSGSGGPAA